VADTEEVTEAEVVGLTSDSLAKVESFEEALAALSEGGQLVSANDIYGDGFKIVKKEQLVGVPFVVLDAKQIEGDHGTFTFVRAITKGSDKVAFSDGSTGVHQQLEELADGRGSVSGLVCEKGLTASTYEYEDAQGTHPATTFYIDYS
jgi:hypothetical protein